MVKHCPRLHCGGQLVQDGDGEWVCLQCGRSPKPVSGKELLRRKFAQEAYRGIEHIIHQGPSTRD